jgi:hypothetical protein
MVSLKIDSKKLKNTMLFLQSTFKVKRNVVVKCNFTVGKNNVSILIPTGSFSIDCETSGTCSTEILFSHFYHIVKDITKEVTEITISQDTLKINNVLINVSTVEYEKSLTTKPTYFKRNYSEIALLKLIHEGRSEVELEARQILKEALTAAKNLKNNTTKVYNILKLYGFNKEEIADMIHKKIHGEG